MSAFKRLRFFLLLSLCLAFNSAYATSVGAIQNTEQFMSLADIHFDPFLSCRSKPCPLIQELEEASVDRWPSIFAHLDTAAIAYGKDSSYSLIQSALVAIKKEGTKAKIQFVLVIGDSLAHDFDNKYYKYATDKSKNGYRAFVKKTLLYLTQQLQAAFPQKNIYLVVGNNDSYGDDYQVEPEGLFFKDLGDLQASLIKNKKDKTAILPSMYKGGYYAVTAASQPRLRLIFLNSVLFSRKAKGKGITQAAENELAWLHRELMEARQKNQQVLIAMHIPTGVDVYSTLFIPFSIIEFWKEKYSQDFLNELQQASKTIMGVFPAHIHADVFQILTQDKQRSIPFTGTPSISPIFGNNPGFKIYSYSLSTLRLVNFTTYYYSLNNRNEWQKEYDFDQVYQLNHSDDGVVTGMKELQPKGKLAEYYKDFYSLSSNSQPITKYNKWLPYYWCAIRGIRAAEYKQCLSSPAG